VLTLVTRHLTNQQIADELVLSVRTVETHISSLLRKLQVTDRRALARLAGRLDLHAGPSRDRWPAQLSTFVGRADERHALLDAVTAHRMVTVTGPGGVGKTRLALRVAQERAATRRDDGWFVDLVRVTDPGMVIAALAQSIDVPEQLGGSLDGAVLARLAHSDGVLVLDNCEHVLSAARSCAELLLTSCPSVEIIATSRARLMAPFEWVYEVPGLSVTGDGGDAVSLFLERARAAGVVEPLDRRQVGALCRDLDGMALAIELAAARCPSLGLDGLVEGLDRRLRLLTTSAGGDDRHRSLRDAIAWSFRLLTEPDQVMLCQVSVFASWFDVDAASAVSGPGLHHAEVGDALARLADQHLLVVAPGMPTRYRALETIRQYGAEQLGARQQRDATLDRHRRWCGQQLSALAAGPYDRSWCDRVDQVAADVRGAILSASEQRQRPAACTLAEQFAGLLLLRGHLAESQRRYEQAAELSPAGVERARLLRLASGAAAARVTGNEALRLLGESAREASAAGDGAAAAGDLAWMTVYRISYPGIIAVLPGPEQSRSWQEEARRHVRAARSPRAVAAVATATALDLPVDDPGAVAALTRASALAKDAGDPLIESVALDGLCAHHMAYADLDGALAALRRREGVLRAVSLDASTAFQFNDFLLMASELHLAAGDLPTAARYADTLAALACYREQDHLATSRRIKVDALAGDLDGAAERGESFLAGWERAGRPLARTLNVTAYAVAMVHGLLGDEDRRRQWSEITVELMDDPARLSGCATGWAPTFDALVALDRDRPDLALQRLSADIDDPDVWRAWIPGMWRPWYAALWAEAAVLGVDPDAPDRLRRASAATSQNPVATTIVRRAVDLHAGNPGMLAAHARRFADLGCPYQERRTSVLLAGTPAPARHV